MSKTQYDRVWNYIESGKSEGAKVALGGEKRNTNGYWVDPTSKGLFPFCNVVIEVHEHSLHRCQADDEDREGRSESSRL